MPAKFHCLEKRPAGFASEGPWLRPKGHASSLISIKETLLAKGFSAFGCIQNM